MREHTYATQEKQNSTTPRVTKEPSTGGTASFVDNRPATVYQRKLQEAMTVQRTIPVPQAPRRPPQGSPRFQQIATAMGEHYGVDTSALKGTHNSSFPASVNAEATIQGDQIHFAPGRDTDNNIRHEISHAIDNTLHGLPKGDRVVQGQGVDTTREKVVDGMARSPIAQTLGSPTPDPVPDAPRISPGHCFPASWLPPVPRAINTPILTPTEVHSFPRTPVALLPAPLSAESPSHVALGNRHKSTRRLSCAGGGVLQRQLDKDRFNVVGEQHFEDKDRLKAEIAFTRFKTNGPYYPEHVFSLEGETLSREKVNVIGDPPFWRLYFSVSQMKKLWDIFYKSSHRKKQIENISDRNLKAIDWIVEDINKEFDEAATERAAIEEKGLYYLPSSTSIAGDERIALPTAEILKISKNIASPLAQFESELEAFEKAVNDFNQEEFIKTAERCNAILNDEIMSNFFEGIKAKRPLAHATWLRSEEMHLAAREAEHRGMKGVWKVGVQHREQLEEIREGYEEEEQGYDYKIVQEEEFEVALINWWKLNKGRGIKGKVKNPQWVEAIMSKY